MVRIALLLALLRWCSSPVQGQYTFHLESGDSITAPSYFLRLDSIGYPGGKLGINEVLYMRTKKGVYVFKLPTGPARQIRMYDFGSPCAVGKMYAERYEHMDRVTHKELLERLTALDDPAYASCFKKAMFVKGSDLDRPDRPGLDKGIEALTVERSMIILRTGDTLRTEGSLYMMGDSLVYSRLFERIHMDEVLIQLTINGQRIIDRKYKVSRLLDPPVRDLTACSKGLIYAAIYFGTEVQWSDIPNIGPLKDEQEALNCFKADQTRLRLAHPNRSK